MEKEKRISINFRLGQIETQQFALIEEYYKEGEEVKFSIAFNSRSNKDKRVFSVNAKITFDQGSNIFMIIDVACHFIIEEPDWKKLTQKNGSIVLPKDFVAHLAALTAGTARGILHAKTESTKYNQYFLPPVNVAAMIKGDVTL